MMKKTLKPFARKRSRNWKVKKEEADRMDDSSKRPRRGLSTKTRK